MSRSKTPGAAKQPTDREPVPDTVLGRLNAAEAHQVLLALLQNHPELVPEAEGLAREQLAPGTVEAIAGEVERTFLGLDHFLLSGRSGRSRYGYVEPTEAAWYILEEHAEPFRAELRRHIDLDDREGAERYCEGLVEGLYRCHCANHGERVLAYAPDFPAGEARDAVVALRRAGWDLSGGCRDRWPEWKTMLGGGQGECIRLWEEEVDG
jgi:hypothetical protein